ncbi:MAG: hypothetical protein IKU37_05420 [Candidatus Gastranaerophilales bacterium]|nr:hypothetical protein [Candidatus Gastranaerophilales bacterium]
MLNLQNINQIRSLSPALKLIQPKTATNTIKLKPQLTADVFQLSFGSNISTEKASSDELYSLDQLTTKIIELRTAESSEELENLTDEFLHQASENKTNIADFLSEKGLDCETALKFLYGLCKEEETGKVLVAGLTKNPKESQEIYNKLVSAIASNEKDEQLFNSWFQDEIAGYKVAFKNYYRAMLRDKNTGLEDIVKFSPNVAPWVLVEKAGRTDFTIGNLPGSDDPAAGKFSYELTWPNDYRKFVYDIANLGENEEKRFGYNNENSVKLISPGESAKRVYRITTKNQGDYILKADPIYPRSTDWYSNRIRENLDLRADMPYTNAMIDFYLKFNGLEDSVADVQFYDHLTGSILYKATDGEACIDEFDPEIFENVYIFRMHPTAKKYQEVGIYLNDMNPQNFLKDKNGNIVLIDTGHANYKDPLKPLTIGMVVLSNLCGRTL